MRGNYTLTVKDFGPIGEATLELRPLTVFVGPSNTGKSYLATLLYALHRCLRDRGALPVVPDRGDPDPDLVTQARLAEWAADTVKSMDDTNRPLPTFPEEVNEFVKSFLVTAAAVAPAMERELMRCFGVTSAQELVRRPQATQARIGLGVPRNGNRGSFEYHIGISGEGLAANGEVTGDNTFALDRVDSVHTQSLRRHVSGLGRLWLASSTGDYPIEDPLERASYMEHVLYRVCETVRSWLLQPFSKLESHYLPSDRAGIVHTRDIVLRSLIHRASTTNREQPASLSGVAADLLDQLMRLPGTTGDVAATYPLARRLEKSVLGGEVRVELSDADYPLLWYRPDGWSSDLPLNRTSSMVSELAPIVLYLRHVIGSEDVVIIDEPEAHLHPASQVEVVRLLAEVVRSGVRVIITTHSEWLLDELANIVRGSEVRGEQSRSGGEDAVVLRPDEVGAWLFNGKNEERGVVVEELQIDDAGLYPTGFDKVAVALHNRWAEIDSRLGTGD